MFVSSNGTLVHCVMGVVVLLNTCIFSDIIFNTVSSSHCRYFSHKPGAYYSDSLFFLSIAIHNVMPNSLEKVIMLDADLKFKTDINQLYKLFNEFSDDAILGVFYHLLMGYT